MRSTSDIDSTSACLLLYVGMFYESLRSFAFQLVLCLHIKCWCKQRLQFCEQIFSLSFNSNGICHHRLLQQTLCYCMQACTCTHAVLIELLPAVYTAGIPCTNFSSSQPNLFFRPLLRHFMIFSITLSIVSTNLSLNIVAYCYTCIDKCRSYIYL